MFSIADKYTVGSGKNIDLLKDLSSCRDVRKISWKLNGNPLDLVDNPAYIGGTIDCPVLNVQCATKQESGKYKCTLVLESLPTKELQFTLDLNGKFLCKDPVQMEIYLLECLAL